MQSKGFVSRPCSFYFNKETSQFINEEELVFIGSITFIIDLHHAASIHYRREQFVSNLCTALDYRYISLRMIRKCETEFILHRLPLPSLSQTSLIQNKHGSDHNRQSRYIDFNCSEFVSRRSSHAV
jgi:hypothetical protein